MLRFVGMVCILHWTWSLYGLCCADDDMGAVASSSYTFEPTYIHDSVLVSPVHIPQIRRSRPSLVKSPAATDVTARPMKFITPLILLQNSRLYINSPCDPRVLRC